RLAEPGGFTRRAFLNDKLDLTQAEAVADLAAAETEAQRRQALRQLDGHLGGVYRGWGERLLRLLAHLEAAIDFPDEDLPPEIEREVAEGSRALANEVESHLDDGHRGERLRDGIAVAILGPPNAGKSSLLNALARREAAITSPIAGTTRDVIEGGIGLAGYPLVLAGTAWLRRCGGGFGEDGRGCGLRWDGAGIDPGAAPRGAGDGFGGCAAFARGRSAGVAGRRSAPRLAQPGPDHRAGRCRGPARCDLPRFLSREMTRRCFT